MVSSSPRSFGAHSWVQSNRASEGNVESWLKKSDAVVSPKQNETSHAQLLIALLQYTAWRGNQTTIGSLQAFQGAVAVMKLNSTGRSPVLAMACGMHYCCCMLACTFLNTSPTLSCTSRYFETQRSTHAISPTTNSGSFLIR